MIKYLINFPYKLFCTIILSSSCIASAIACDENDTTVTSTQKEAIYFIENIQALQPSTHWPNVKPALFLKNLKEDIYNPLSIYEGSNVNFCGYAALSYLPLHHNPLGYIKFMLELYANGKATLGKVFINPSKPVKLAAGTLKFKGALDIRPADQLWFLSLADHFKGYVNFFNKHYDPGDENTFWASVNYAKFNRMVKKLFNYELTTKGYDLMHPHVHNLYQYIKNKMDTGTVVLYINNAYLYKKKHNTLRPAIPTHFIILLDIIQTGDLITITYWDYGFRSVRQITPAFLKKIVFGITCCIKKLA